MSLTILELRRKSLHIIFGISAVLLIRAGFLDTLRIMVVLLLGLGISFSSKRMRLPLIGWLLDLFDRPGEKIPGRGALTYLAGIALVMLLFGPGDITYASIMILAIGDSFNTLIGQQLSSARHLRKTRHPLAGERFLEGTLFAVVAASIGALLFVSLVEAISASVVAMLLESLDRHLPVDDNITVPLAAAVTITIVRLALQAFGGV